MGSPAQLGYRRYRRPWRRGPPRPPRSLWRSLMDAGIFIAAAVLILVAVRIFNQVTVMPGTVDIIDGDSFRRGKNEIRLSGRKRRPASSGEKPRMFCMYRVM